MPNIFLVHYEMLYFFRYHLPAFLLDYSFHRKVVDSPVFDNEQVLEEPGEVPDEVIEDIQ